MPGHSYCASEYIDLFAPQKPSTKGQYCRHLTGTASGGVRGLEQRGGGWGLQAAALGLWGRRRTSGRR